VLIQDDPVTEPMGLRVDLAASRAREQVVQLGSRRNVIGMLLG